jgi:DNA repair protein RadC
MKQTKVGHYRCSLVRETGYDYDPVKGPSEVARIIRAAIPADDPREHVVIVALNTRNRPILVSTISIGSVNGSLVHPREAFRPAILVGATSIVFGHNHPSGDVVPSREDRDVTIRLLKAGQIIGIDLVDAIVVGDSDAYYSFKERGEI